MIRLVGCLRGRLAWSCWGCPKEFQREAKVGTFFQSFFLTTKCWLFQSNSLSFFLILVSKSWTSSLIFCVQELDIFYLSTSSIRKYVLKLIIYDYAPFKLCMNYLLIKIILHFHHKLHIFLVELLCYDEVLRIIINR